MENELYHYGTLGMKWGIRRYQNYDGTLTEEGAARLEKHYNKSQAKVRNYTTKASKALITKNNLSDKINKLANKLSKIDESKSEKLNKKIEKMQNKLSTLEKDYDKYSKKAEKWINAMDSAFSKINYSSIPEKDINSGKEYVNFINAIQTKVALQESINANNKYLKSIRG